MMKEEVRAILAAIILPFKLGIGSAALGSAAAAAYGGLAAAILHAGGARSGKPPEFQRSPQQLYSHA